MINIPGDALIADLYYAVKDAPGAPVPAVTEETPSFKNIHISNISCKGAGRAMFLNGLPETINITGSEVRDAMSEPLARIVDAIKYTLEQTPPDLSADIIDRGIILSGGGALLRGIDRLIHKETGMPVLVAEYPLDCVAEGTGKLFSNLERYQDAFMEDNRY